MREYGVGAIHIDVRLTNAVDEALVFQGSVVKDDVRKIVARAMVDTGAIRSVLPQAVVDELGILLRGTGVAQYADGRTEEVQTTGPVLFEIDGRETLEEAFVLGDEVLIGQTVLEKLDFLADCARQQLIPAHPEGPVFRC